MKSKNNPKTKVENKYIFTRTLKNYFLFFQLRIYYKLFFPTLFGEKPL